jgi:hypothetical protein
MERELRGKGHVAGRQNRRDATLLARQPISIFGAVNGANHRPGGRRQSAHTAAEHKVVADRAEEDKFGKQQAWGQSTCKLLPGTEAVLLLCVGNIS